jgi:hypothetical protein
MLLVLLIYFFPQLVPFGTSLLETFLESALINLPSTPGRELLQIAMQKARNFLESSPRGWESLRSVGNGMGSIYNFVSMCFLSYVGVSQEQSGSVELGLAWLNGGFNISRLWRIQSIIMNNSLTVPTRSIQEMATKYCNSRRTLSNACSVFETACSAGRVNCNDKAVSVLGEQLEGLIPLFEDVLPQDDQIGWSTIMDVRRRMIADPLLAWRHILTAVFVISKLQSWAFYFFRERRSQEELPLPVLSQGSGTALSDRS